MKIAKISSAKFNFYSLLILGILAFSGLAVLLFKILPRFNSLVETTCRHVGNSCQQFTPFNNPIISIPYIFLWGFAVLIIVVGLVTFLYQVSATLRFKKELSLRTTECSQGFTDLLRKLGLENKVFVVRDSRVFSFCLGFISPKIYLSDSIFSKLNSAEIEAVLLHEKYHLEHRDPLKILISQSIKSAFFFLPIFKDLNDSYIIGKELAADKKAVNLLGEKRTLIEALFKVLTFQSIFRSQGVVAGQLSATKERIKALEEPEKVKRVKVSFLNIGLSLVVIFLLVFLGTKVGNATTFQNCSSSACNAGYQCGCGSQCAANSGADTCLINSN